MYTPVYTSVNTPYLHPVYASMYTRYTSCVNNLYTTIYGMYTGVYTRCDVHKMHTIQPPAAAPEYRTQLQAPLLPLGDVGPNAIP